MLGKVTTILLLALSAIGVNADSHSTRLIHKRAPQSVYRRYLFREAPAGYSNCTLEPYADYHIRYMAINCPVQHGTSFYESCCHPRLQNQTNSDFPAECNTPVKGAPQPSFTVEKNGNVVAGDGAVVATGVVLSGAPQIVAAAEGLNTTTSSHKPAKTSSKVSSSSPSKSPPPKSSSVSSSSQTPQKAATPKALAVTTSSTTTTSTTTTTSSKTSSTPTPSSTPAPPPPKPQTTSQPPQATPNTATGLLTGVLGALNGIVSQVFQGGQGTFFYQTNTGACGKWLSDSTPLVALDWRMYGDINAVSQYCFKTVRIVNLANGKTVDAVVNDACPTCANKDSLMSTGAFDQIGDEVTGVLDIAWGFLD